MNGRGTSFLRYTVYFSTIIGLLTGMAFVLIAGILIGSEIVILPLVVSALLLGMASGVTMALCCNSALKRRLQGQLKLLRPWMGGAVSPTVTVEGVELALRRTVEHLEESVGQMLIVADESIPHFKFLSDSSRYLSDRARDGLDAAQRTGQDIAEMTGKQQEVMEQVQHLSARAQGEAALARELSASLEEMAGALDLSNANFLETTASVDEMAASVREAATRTEGIANAVEETAHDLDGIGESLEKIRAGAVEGAGVTERVKKDAEAGLKVVNTSTSEMARIESESQRAVEGMQRLSAQAAEVVQIIGVIKELVSDTELLAFNAAIIAAQAGDNGRGFAVVAEEIRALADRTTDSAQGIQRIVSSIAEETQQVLTAVETTGTYIARGRQLSLEAGEALRKIVDSSGVSARTSGEIAELTTQQETRARQLLLGAGENLGAVRIIARAMEEQQTAIGRIQAGVMQMKGAADQISRGMEEQVRANHEFTRGLNEREGQIEAIHEATRAQLEVGQRVQAHFASSAERLKRNGERVAEVMGEIQILETLAARQRLLATGEERRQKENRQMASSGASV